MPSSASREHILPGTAHGTLRLLLVCHPVRNCRVSGEVRVTSPAAPPPRLLLRDGGHLGVRLSHHESRACTSPPRRRPARAGELAVPTPIRTNRTIRRIRFVRILR